MARRASIVLGLIALLIPLAVLALVRAAGSLAGGLILAGLLPLVLVFCALLSAVGAALAAIAGHTATSTRRWLVPFLLCAPLAAVEITGAIALWWSFR